MPRPGQLPPTSRYRSRVSDRHAKDSPWVILGCGYTGARLAARLVAEGARVVATRRSEADARALAARVPGIEPRVADLARPETLDGWIPRGAIVVDSAPPGAPGGEHHLVAAAACAGAARLVYLSSTGVYAPAGGAWVDESFATEPAGERGRARLAAETALLESAAAASLEAVSLRIAGIYGPGRGVHARIARGDYRVLGAGDRMVSRIHVDDLAAAIVAAGTADPLSSRIYNVADDAPTTSRAHADGVAALLGLPPPPSLPPEQASAAARAMLGADRKIDNGRLVRELGVRLRHPSWQEGARQAIEEDGLGAPGAGGACST